MQNFQAGKYIVDQPNHVTTVTCVYLSHSFSCSPCVTTPSRSGVQPRRDKVSTIPKNWLRSDSSIKAEKSQSRQKPSSQAIMATNIVPYEIAELIRRKKALYCRSADTKQWRRFSEFALPEATFTFVDALTPDIPMTEGGQCMSFSHRDAFLNYFEERNKDLQYIHSVGPGELYFVDGKDRKEVKAIWSVIFHVGDGEETRGFHGTGAGYYHEVWVKVGDDWFIRSLRFERVYWKLVSFGTGAQ